MRSFDQLKFLDAGGIQLLAERVMADRGPEMLKLALSETFPAVRRHVLEALRPEQKRAVIESRAPEGISHDALPAARWEIMELAAKMEEAGELHF